MYVNKNKLQQEGIGIQCEPIKLHWEYVEQFTPTTTERKEVVKR